MALLHSNHILPLPRLIGFLLFITLAIIKKERQFFTWQMCNVAFSVCHITNFVAVNLIHPDFECFSLD